MAYSRDSGVCSRSIQGGKYGKLPSVAMEFHPVSHDSKKLSFCEITLVRSNIVQITPMSGTVIGLGEVNTFIEYLSNFVQGDIALLEHRQCEYVWRAPLDLGATQALRIIAWAVVDANSVDTNEASDPVFILNPGIPVAIFNAHNIGVRWLEAILKLESRPRGPG